MRVAFFGGSFDPPHCGHLAIARAARDRVGLGRVLFAPVGLQPLKQDGAMAAFDDRVEMVRLAVAGERGFEVSLVDAPAGGSWEVDGGAAGGTPNYTAETLERLQAEMPGDELYLLVGADSLRTLKRWHRAAEIPFLARLIVASRPGEELEDVGAVAASLPEGVLIEAEAGMGHALDGGLRGFGLRNDAGLRSELILLPGLHYEVSATEVREAIGAGAGTVSGVIPDAVLGYIGAHGLYR